MELFGLKCTSLLAIVILATLIGEQNKAVSACELDDTQNGCRIDNGNCNCSYGCKSEFRYATRKECMDALKGRLEDVCYTQPCMNGGVCIQISQSPGYRCRCEGTNYWGSRCQRLCPTQDEAYLIDKYPYECIVI